MRREGQECTCPWHRGKPLRSWPDASQHKVIESDRRESELPLRISEKLTFFVTSIAQQAIRVLAALAMARLLRPEDYGQYTLITVVPSFLSALGDWGMAKALVQYRDEPKESIEDTGLIVRGLLGLLYACALVGSGAYWAHQKHLPQLVLLGAIVGAATFIAAIYDFEMACLNRDLKFGAESRQNILFSLAQAGTGVCLAALHFGVFSIAMQQLGAQVLASVALFRRHPRRFPRQFSPKYARMLVGYGWQVTAAQYVNNLQDSIPDLFIATVAGTTGLGVYGRATQVADMVGHNIVGSFDRVLHPTLRAVRDDAKRFAEMFARGTEMAVMLTSIGAAWMIASAPDLILVILGPQWSGVPALLRVVAGAMAFSGLGLMGIVVTNAAGKPLVWLRFAVGIVALLSTGSAIALVIEPAKLAWLHGVAGLPATQGFQPLSLSVVAFSRVVWIAASVAIAQGLGFVALWTAAARMAGARIRNAIGPIAAALSVSLVALAVMIGVRAILLHADGFGGIGQRALPRLVLTSFAGFGAFVGLVWTLMPKMVQQLRSMVALRRS